MTTSTRPRMGSGIPARDRRLRGEDEWLTVDDVCRIVKIGRRTFERYLSRGTGPRVRRLPGNGLIRIRRDWLDDWMEEGTA